MVCPNCNKIIAEGSETCPFCKVQFSQATVPGEAASRAAQMPYAPQPYVPQPLTPQQKYQTLGGLLQFLVVVWKFVLPILSGLLLLYALVVSFSGILNPESISCITAIKIERR